MHAHVPQRRLSFRASPASNVRSVRRAAVAVPASTAADSDVLKQQLRTLTADVDRGLKSSASQSSEIRAAASELECAGPAVSLSWQGAGRVRCGNEVFNGNWRLLYSSAFEGGNLGGSRPGPPAGLSPVSLGDIYQRVDATAGVIDNIVTLKFPKPFFLPNAQQPAAQACLRHSYSVVDGNEVKIVYESTSAEPLLDSAPVTILGRHLRLEPPAIQRLLPADMRSATFRVTYLDADVRVTRGDRGELRVYAKDDAALERSPDEVQLEKDVPDPEQNTTFESSDDEEPRMRRPARRL